MKSGFVNDHILVGDLSLSFSWASRINVAIDVAKALTFLHGREIGVGHWNVEASNILLDYVRYFWDSLRCLYLSLG